MAGAIYFLHTYGIVHRDMKLENVMMSDNSEQAVPKLVDFGLAAVVSPDKRVKDSVGTVSYAAPEILEGKSYDKAVDVWSLGIIFYVLLVGYLPFDSEDKAEIVKKTINDPTPFDEDKWENISSNAKKLIKVMLKKGRRDRASIEEVLNSPWLL
jgi:serine/threonine protein kinase